MLLSGALIVLLGKSALDESVLDEASLEALPPNAPPVFAADFDSDKSSDKPCRRDAESASLIGGAFCNEGATEGGSNSRRAKRLADDETPALFFSGAEAELVGAEGASAFDEMAFDASAFDASAFGAVPLVPLRRDADVEAPEREGVNRGAEGFCGAAVFGTAVFGAAVFGTKAPEVEPLPVPFCV